MSDRAGSLVDSVLESVQSMPWLTDADKASVALAVTYAAQIDQVLQTGTAEQVTKAMYLGPHLLRVLESLGGSPSGREAHAEGPDQSPTDAARAKLRLLRADAQRTGA